MVIIGFRKAAEAAYMGKTLPKGLAEYGNQILVQKLLIIKSGPSSLFVKGGQGDFEKAPILKNIGPLP